MVKRSGFIHHSLEGGKLVYHYEGSMFLFGLFFSAIHGLSWGLQLITTQYFFDSMVQLANHELEMLKVVPPFLMMIAIFALTQVMNGVDSVNARILNLKMGKHSQLLILKKIDTLKAIDFETPEKLTFIHQAMNGSENMLSLVLTLTDIVTFYFTYFIFLSWYLFSLKPILAWSILIVFIPTLISYIMQLSFFEKLEEDIAPQRRKTEYYQKMRTNTNEIRLLGANHYFRKLSVASQKKMNQQRLRLSLKKNAFSCFLELLTVCGYGVILYVVMTMVVKKEVSIGAFAAIVASIGSIFNFMEEVITERISWAMESVPSVARFFSFLSEDNDTSLRLVQKSERITLNNVSFSYPSSEEKSLEGVNLTIKKGQTVAIVGLNGSGKTTLCQLILGLYEPTTGEVLFGEGFSTSAQSVVFQAYCRYKASLKENIVISQLSKAADDSDISQLCRQYHLAIDHPQFVNGVDTLLGREFGGKELSGGQWQRLAIMRGVFREHELIVLDEPTSSIDPLEETRLYQEFMEICEGKTALIVTHRIASAKRADRILVLKDGRIVEDGSHKELVATKGAYQQLLLVQSQWYT